MHTLALAALLLGSAPARAQTNASSLKQDEQTAVLQQIRAALDSLGGGGGNQGVYSSSPTLPVSFSSGSAAYPFYVYLVGGAPVYSTAPINVNLTSSGTRTNPLWFVWDSSGAMHVYDSTFSLNGMDLLATKALQTSGNSSLTSIDNKTPALGQALAANSSPVVLTAIQQAALTPPAAITGYALEAGNLASILAQLQAVLRVSLSSGSANTPFYVLPGGAFYALGSSGTAALPLVVTHASSQTVNVVPLGAFYTLGSSGTVALPLIFSFASSPTVNAAQLNGWSVAVASGNINVYFSSGSVALPLYFRAVPGETIATYSSNTFVHLVSSGSAADPLYFRLVPGETMPTTSSITYVRLTSSGSATDPLYFRLLDSNNADLTSAKGTQTARFIGVQEAKDASRAIFIASVTALAGATSDTVISFSTLTFGSPAGAAASSITVPPGKTTRLTYMTASYRVGTAGQSNSGIVRLRAQPSGTCTATSPIIYEVAISSNFGQVTVGNASAAPAWFPPDGVEFSGNNTFCASQQMVNTNAGLTVIIGGINY